MMARWTAAGSLANVLAPLLVAVGFALAWGWRWSYLSIAALGLGLVFATARARFPAQHSHSESSPEETRQALRQLLPNLWKAVRTPGVIRWLLLLDFSDMLLDVLYSYTALYFADVADLTPAQVGVVLTILTSASLVADLVLIPVLERMPGRSLVRVAAGLAIPLYAAFLLAPWPVAKIVLLVLVRFSTMGWYPVLQGELYASLPGRSGTAMAISSASGVLAGALVCSVGWVAEQTSLPAAMWLLMLGPLCLVTLVPHRQPASQAFQKEEPL
jgi:FSR family fosmidomycin resistance protein-like MFS transporter